MSLLKGSTNYIWCTTSILGKGATGAVYQGIHKLNGKAVAVKTFNQISHMRPQDVQMREFDALKMVNHENIVKLLAIEEEQNTHNKVIVMELCTGGSLFTILDDPENHYGLNENEFVLVLSHLASGMNHLRERKLIHRDLKPGNIMKYINDDGRSVYKLVDFGAARELEDDQQFMSLYGTEEYLHPDMYERAVLHKPVSKTFDATVDLWSIGVTLYHIATGALPFRPYGGRRNRETMHLITTEKESGIISGVQITENGRIEWSSELPRTCQFSIGLRSLVTPLLAGLLECDQKKMWGFSKFFSKVTEIVSKVVLHVLYINEMSPLRLYLDANYSLKDLNDQLLRQTGVTSTNQILLFNGNVIHHNMAGSLKLTDILKTSPDNLLMMLDRKRATIDDKLSASLLVKFPVFPSTVTSVENDAAIGKISCSVAYAVLRLVHKLINVHDSFLKAPGCLIASVRDDLYQVKNRVVKLVETFHFNNSHLDLLAALHKSMMQLLCITGHNEQSEQDVFIKRIDEIVNERLQSKLMMHNQLKNIEAKVNSFYERIYENNQLQCDWLDSISNISTNLSKCPDKALTHTKKIRESWQSLVRDKAARNLSFHEEQFHALEKVKIHQAGQKELGVLQDEGINCCIQLAQRLQTFIGNLQPTLNECKSLNDDVASVTKSITTYECNLKEAEQEYKQQMEMIVSMMKNKFDFVAGNELPSQKPIKNGPSLIKAPTRPCSCSDVNMSRLHELSDAHDEIRSALGEHQMMIHEFEKLTLLLMEQNSSK